MTLMFIFLMRQLWNNRVGLSVSDNGYVELEIKQGSEIEIAHKRPLDRYLKLRVAHAPGMAETFSAPLQVSDPDMYHGTCVTHVPWCMLGSLTSAFLWNLRWGNVPDITGACAANNFTDLVRGPCTENQARDTEDSRYNRSVSVSAVGIAIVTSPVTSNVIYITLMTSRGNLERLFANQKPESAPSME